MKWAGWASTYNTWEPTANLAGCELLIKDFRKKLEEKNKVLAAKEAEAKAKRMAERQQELDLARTGDVQRPAGAVEAAGGAAPNADAADSNPKAHLYGSWTRTCTSKFKTMFFKPDKSDKTIAYCTCPSHRGSGICNDELNPTHGASVFQNHLRAYHPNEFLEAEAQSRPTVPVDASPAGSDSSPLLNRNKLACVSNQERGRVQEKHALWVVKRRPNRSPQRPRIPRHSFGPDQRLVQAAM